MNRKSSPSSGHSQSSRGGDRPGEPEILSEHQRLEKASGLDRIRALSYLLDSAIPVPGTDYSFGLDPIIGLLPAGGDVIGTVLSAYIVLEAARFRLPIPTLTRMMFNIVLEMLVGMIPVLGDLFDAGWKANAKNLRLLEAHLHAPDVNKAADKKFFIVLVVAFIVIIAVQIALYVAVFQLISSFFTS
ncbi:MAG: DUF4112 domain-containing protein [Leptolyngbyaceae bacterium]|nr:DUF4112 domain-containing protein [Leptolyngbyaceae bacterium]